MTHLYAIHDISRDWPSLLRDGGVTGYAIQSESIGDDPTNQSGENYTWLSGYGVTPIARLNYSHHGNGTIPLPASYNDFAERCANFVTASQGCTHWIIGNETNIVAERYGGIPITPRSYADCFTKCRNLIKQRGLQHNVIPAAIAPYNVDTGWCMDYWRQMLEEIALSGDDAGADSLAIHCYSRGPDPASVTSEDKMDAPYQEYHNGFRAYRDFLALVPAVMRALPVYITETDQLEPWKDANTGWVRAAYAEIDTWNQATSGQNIHCLALYRWENHDQWGFKNKNGVINDLRSALVYGYQTPTVTPPTPSPEPPRPPQPQPPTPDPEPEPRSIDPRLYARGVTFDFAKVPAGTGYWRITNALWLDEQEADAIGPDHHILGTIVRSHAEVAGVLLRVDWPGGGVASVVSKAAQANATYNWDWPMSSSLNEFAVQVYDGKPSDKASGIGMGKLGNPSIHTSTWIDFEWTISAGLTPPAVLPPLTPVTGHLIWPVTGPITQYFGEPPAAFGQPGHGGIDIAVPGGTPVLAIADGVVMYTGTDRDYGSYVRVYHPSIHSHSFYAHLSSYRVQPNQPVKQGDELAVSGNTGNSTGPHLHYELRAGNKDSYYAGVTFGYTSGRYNPTDAYALTGSPLTPGAER